MGGEVEFMKVRRWDDAVSPVPCISAELAGRGRTNTEVTRYGYRASENGAKGNEQKEKGQNVKYQG